MGMLIDIRPGETVEVNGSGRAVIALVSKSGNLARLDIEADNTISITPPRRTSAREVAMRGITVGKNDGSTG